MPFPVHAAHAFHASTSPWVDEHREQLSRHVNQCWARRLSLALSHGAEAVHTAIGGRFVTCVVVAALIMGLPQVWT